MTKPTSFEPIGSFSKWLNERLEEEDMSMMTLSRLTGLSASSIAGYVKDEHEPSLFAVCCICKAFGYTVGIKKDDV